MTVNKITLLMKNSSLHTIWLREYFSEAASSPLPQTVDPLLIALSMLCPLQSRTENLHVCFFIERRHFLLKFLNFSVWSLGCRGNINLLTQEKFESENISEVCGIHLWQTNLSSISCLRVIEFVHYIWSLSGVGLISEGTIENRLKERFFF